MNPEKYSVWNNGKHFKEEEKTVEEIMEVSNKDDDSDVNKELQEKLVAKFSRIVSFKTRTIDIFDDDVLENENYDLIEGDFLDDNSKL